MESIGHELPMNVANWLTANERTNSPYRFSVFDLEESQQVPSRQDLAGLLRESYWGNDYLASVASKFGWGPIEERLSSWHPTGTEAIARGDFGESVFSEFLRQAEGYEIPLSKLRYKFTAGQSLPGPDCVAFKHSDAQILDVAFLESKYRSVKDLSVAIDAAKQLSKGADGSNAGALVFIARILREQGHPLSNSIETYVFGETEDQSTHMIGLLIESGMWDEQILANLEEDEGIELDPLRVYVARVNNLNRLCECAFQGISDG